MSSNKLNYAFESYILYAIINNEDVMKRYSDKVDKDFKDKIDLMYTEASTLLKTVESEVNDLFNMIKGTSFSDNSKILHPYVLMDYYLNVKNYNAHKFMEDYLMDILLDVDKNLTVFEVIAQSELSSKDKWNLLSLLENPKLIISQIEIIENILSPLIKKYETMFKLEINNLNSEWDKLINEEEVTGFIRDKMNFSSGKEITKKYVSIVNNSASIFISNTAYIGLNHTKEFLENLKMTSEDAISIMKILGDTSKFGILKELLDGKKYGRELASNLDLSGATISYHMQELLNNSLINVSGSDVNKRIYYEIEKDKIKEALDFIKKELGIE